HVFSVDHTKNFVFTSEGTIQTRRRLTPVYWNVADDLQAMMFAHNTSDHEIQAQATLTFDRSDGSQGIYKLTPFALAANATNVQKLKSISTSGQADADGNVIPAGTTFGSLTIETIGADNVEVLAGGSAMFDPDEGQYGGDILPLCSPNGPQFGPFG